MGVPSRLPSGEHGAQVAPGACRARVALLGATGRLGSFVRELLDASEDFALVAAWTSADDWRRDLPDTRAELAFDATRAGLGAEHGHALLTAGVRPVIATSGVTPDEVVALDACARELGLGGFVVPNFSLGALWLERLARELAPHFAQAAIVETHRPEKRDAPSGTALSLARVLAAGGLADVPIESRRLAGHYAHHELRLEVAGEALTLRHDMTGPEAFGAGILASLHAARGAVGVQVGLAAVLG